MTSEYFCVQENCLNLEVVEQIYKRNPILRHSHHPLHSPLLPLPYGDVHLPGEYRPLGGSTTVSENAWNLQRRTTSQREPVSISSRNQKLFHAAE